MSHSSRLSLPVATISLSLVRLQTRGTSSKGQDGVREADGGAKRRKIFIGETICKEGKKKGFKDGWNVMPSSPKKKK